MPTAGVAAAGASRPGRLAVPVGRLRHLGATPATPTTDDSEARALRAHLAKLDRAQHNLLAQLEAFEPTGDDDADTEWRTSLQKRFATISADRRRTAVRVTELESRPTPDAAPSADEKAALLDLLPITSQDLTQLPEDVQRQLYDAFHLQIRYDHARRRVTLRVTVSADTVHTLADTVTTATGPAGQPHPVQGSRNMCACGTYPRRETTQDRTNS